MLTNHVLNVTSLIEDAHIFFMVRYKEDVGNPRRFWFARGNLRNDFILHGLKSNGIGDHEIVGSDAATSDNHPVLQPTESSDQEDAAGDTNVEDDDDDDDHCPVRKGVGGPTMNRIAKDDDDDDDDDEKGGGGMDLNCTGDEDDIDDCDAFPMLVQGEEDVSSAFDGMRNVKPVEEDDQVYEEAEAEEDDRLDDLAKVANTQSRSVELAYIGKYARQMRDGGQEEDEEEDDVMSRLTTQTETTGESRLRVDDSLQPLASHALDVFPPCIEFEREEEISDVGSFGIECKDLRIPRQQNPTTETRPKRKKNNKNKSAGFSPQNLANCVVIDGKRMEIKPGPKTKTAAQISPVWKFFGFLECNGVEQFQGYTICRLCLKRVSRASHTTKGMRDHLLLWHRELWRSVGVKTENESQQQQQQRQQCQRQQQHRLPRWQPTDQESSVLALHFLRNQFPGGEEYVEIAEKIDKNVGVVKQWFVNQRRRGFPARRFLPPEVLRCHNDSGSKTRVTFS